jgi:hypothetical protein
MRAACSQRPTTEGDRPSALNAFSPVQFSTVL